MHDIKGWGSASMVLLLVGVLNSGCAEPDTSTQPSQSRHGRGIGSQAVAEEELYGNIYVGGAKSNGFITLTPDAATLARLRTTSPGAYQATIDAIDGTRTWMYGWFDPAASDGPCRGDNTTSAVTQVQDYLNGNRTAGTHGGVHSDDLSPEPHCIRPGTYTLNGSAAGNQQTFVIDYMASAANGAGSALVVNHGALQELIEPLSYPLNGSSIVYGDYVAHLDLPASGSFAETPVLEIQNVHAVPLSTADFVAEGQPAGGASATSSDYFRFSVVNSSSTWTRGGVGVGGRLDRLYWDYGVDQNLKTGFYSRDVGRDGILRSHQFTGASGRCVIVGYELKRPDEEPAVVADQTRLIGIGTNCPTGQDLMPMPVSMSATTVTAGQPVTVSFRQHNVGTVSSGTPWTGRIYLSSDATCCTGDVQIGTYTHATAIAAGSYADKSLAVTIPGNTVSGQYYVIAFLDALTQLTEGNENNNKRAQTQLLTVNGLQRIITIDAGNNQTATVNTNVAVAPSVLVKLGGTPESGVQVTFSVTGGGGSTVPVNGIATTNGSGIATLTSWKLGTTAGTNTLSANAPNAAAPATFTATGVAGAATTILINAGNNQTAVKGTTLPINPAVRVNDTFGNPVSGRSVTFAVATGGGSITGGAQTTNASGIATVGSWTLGPNPGTNTLSATSAGLSGSPLTFTATGINLNPPTGVNNPSCSSYVQSGKTYVDYTIAWTPGAGNPGGTGYEIGEALTNNSSQAAVIRSGTTATSDVVGSYLVIPGTSPRYIWVRHTQGGSVTAWVALNSNPLQPADGCLN